MEEISKKKSTVLVIALITMAVMLILGFYFIGFTLTESRLAKSQTFATKTYYLAEAGINEAIWKLKYDDDKTDKDGDPPWAICFVTTSAPCRSDCNATWTASFIRVDLLPDSTTTVDIISPVCARGRITATSSIALNGGKTSQRVVKAKVFKAIGSLTKDSAIFGDGNIELKASTLNIYNGNMAASGNIDLAKGSKANVYDNPTTTEIQEGQVLAGGNITITDSTLNSSSSCAKNVCTTKLCERCPAEEVEVPAIDFDSDRTTSYKSKAEAAEDAGNCSVIGKNAKGEMVVSSQKCLFTQSEFEDRLGEIGEGGKLTLKYKDGSVYYVTGNINLAGKRELEVNGVLVADGNVAIGEKKAWAGGVGNCQITILDPGADIPSGLLSKGNIKFGKYSSFEDAKITGLIYALGNFELVSLPHSYKIVGGQIAGGNFSLISIFKPLNIWLDNDRIQEAVWGGGQSPGGVSTYSPVVTVEHWEEAY